MAYSFENATAQAMYEKHNFNSGLKIAMNLEIRKQQIILELV